MHQRALWRFLGQILSRMGVPHPCIIVPSSMLLIGACLLGAPAQCGRHFYIDFCHQGAWVHLTDTFSNIVHSCVEEWSQLCSDAVINAFALWWRQVDSDSEFSLLMFLLSLLRQTCWRALVGWARQAEMVPVVCWKPLPGPGFVACTTSGCTDADGKLLQADLRSLDQS